MFKVWLRDYASNQTGITAIVVALVTPVLLGAAAFGVEASFWTYRQRLLQQYADAAAYSAAVDMLSGGTSFSVTASAGASLNANGLKSDIGSFTAVSPPPEGPFAGTSAVEVAVQEDWPRFFSALFFDDTVLLSARATAQIEDLGEACMLALDPSRSGAATLTGSTNVSLNGCSLISNSVADDALILSGSSHLSAACAGAAGGVVAAPTNLTLTDCSAPRRNIPTVKDPYEAVPEPPVSGPCKKPDDLGGNPSTEYNIDGGRYCGLTIKRTTNLSPGMYVIDGGDLRISSTASLNGTGVTFFLTNGARLIMNGSVNLNLSAPTSGTYSGLLFYGDRNGSTTSHVLNGSAASEFTGAIYFPNDHLEIRGSNSLGAGCTQFIARTLDLRGNSGAGVDCSDAGTTDIDIIGRVRLVQ